MPNFETEYVLVMKGNHEIIITAETRISNLVKRFKNAFPFLRIEIFRKGEDISHDHRDFRLFEIATIKKPIEFSIDGEMKVSEVESKFWDNLGLQVSIFRKMGTSVVETSFTSQWTLNHQNNKGEEIDFAF